MGKEASSQDDAEDEDVEIIAKSMLDGIAYIIARRPSAFVFENVVALTFKKHRPAFYSLLAKLDGIQEDNGARAYLTEWRVLDTQIHGGLPQSRPRIFILGVRQSRQEHPLFWPPSIAATALGRVLDKRDHVALASWPTVSDTLDGTVVDKLTMSIRHILAQGGLPFRDPWIINSSARRQCTRLAVAKDSCPRTTKARACTGGYYVTNRGRMLTVNEMLRLQGINPKRLCIPPDVTDDAFAVIVGNTAAVPVLARVALRLCKALGIVPSLAQAGLSLHSPQRTLSMCRFTTSPMARVC